jgi:hypothetical protein
MVDLPSVRAAIADALGDLDATLTVSPYLPTVAQAPHAWIDIDVLEPAAFGSDTWNLTGRVTVIVSESDDEAAWATLDSFDPTRIATVMAEAQVVVDSLRIVDYGAEIDVAGQVFRGFVVEFVVMA